MGKMNETLLYYRAGKSTRFLGSFMAPLAWILPATCLALIPQCPLLLALGFARLTGLELSITAATYVRLGIIVVCLSWLSFLIVRLIVRFVFEPSRLSCGA
jgi:hypothetical protein